MRKFYKPEAVTEDHAEPGPRGKHLPFRCQTTAFTGVKVFESAGNYDQKGNFLQETDSLL